MRENNLNFKAGDVTKVMSKSGEVKSVVVYATFNLTEREYRSSLKEMHRLCRAYGHGVDVVNTLCERITGNVGELVEEMDMEALILSNGLDRMIDRMEKN